MDGFPLIPLDAPHLTPDAIGDFRPDEDDARTRWAGLCEFEALAGDDDERRYPNGFRRDEVCRRCGCTPHHACRDDGTGCFWISAWLCSVCDRFPQRRRFRRRRLDLNARDALFAYWRQHRRLSPIEMPPEFYGRA